MTPSPPTPTQAAEIPQQDDVWDQPSAAGRPRGLAVALAALLSAMIILTIMAIVTLFEQNREAAQPQANDASFYSYRLISQVDRLVDSAQRAADGDDDQDFVQRLQALATFVNPGTAESAAGAAVLRGVEEAEKDMATLDALLQGWRDAADAADSAGIHEAARDIRAHARDLRDITEHLANLANRGQNRAANRDKEKITSGFHRLEWILGGLIAGSLVLAVWLLVLNRHTRHFNQRMAQANARLESAVAHRTRQLVWLANTDPLTGLKNRRAFMETAEAQILQCRRYPHPLAALLIDIDHFKSINDRYGHHVGDQAIRRVTDTITNTLRDSDIIGRFGGEEFAALMPHTDLPAALVAAERLRQAVAGMKIGLLEGGPLSMTISIGLAMHEPGVSLDTLLMRADMALYRAKSGSRNRVEVYGREREEIAQ